jgi:hypothetical protein
MLQPAAGARAGGRYCRATSAGGGRGALSALAPDLESMQYTPCNAQLPLAHHAVRIQAASLRCPQAMPQICWQDHVWERCACM